MHTELTVVVAEIPNDGEILGDLWGQPLLGGTVTMALKCCKLACCACNKHRTTAECFIADTTRNTITDPAP